MSWEILVIGAAVIVIVSTIGWFLLTFMVLLDIWRNNRSWRDNNRQ